MQEEQSVFQVIPKVFSIAEVMTLCRTLNLTWCNLGISSTQKVRFVHRGIVLLEYAWNNNGVAYKCLLLPLWHDFGKDHHMAMLVSLLWCIY